MQLQKNKNSALAEDVKTAETHTKTIKKKKRKIQGIKRDRSFSTCSEEQESVKTKPL